MIKDSNLTLGNRDARCRIKVVRKKERVALGVPVDLTGIEPVTSSMPWNEANVKILTAKDLLVG